MVFERLTKLKKYTRELTWREVVVTFNDGAYVTFLPIMFEAGNVKQGLRFKNIYVYDNGLLNETVYWRK